MENIGISLNGQIDFGETDKLASGSLKIQLENFNKLSSSVIKKMAELQKSAKDRDIKKDELSIKNISKRVEGIKTLAERNSETTNEKSVFLIKRNKGGIDYIVNGRGFLDFLREQIKISQEIKLEK